MKKYIEPQTKFLTVREDELLAAVSVPVISSETPTAEAAKPAVEAVETTKSVWDE